MNAPGMVSRVVTFRVGGELFAADILSVERVLRHDAPRPLPGLPDWVEGVIEYSGRVVPVIDLRRRFGMPAGEIGSHTRTIILTTANEWVAAVVDAVLDVRAIEGDDLSPPPSFFRGLAGEYLKGLTRRGEELVVLLDVDRLLSSQERLSLDTASLSDSRG